MIRFDENSGKYSFSDPFFKAYCRMALERIENEEIVISQEDIKSFIENLSIIFDKKPKQ